MIADRLRSNDSHQSGVVKPVNVIQTFPQSQKLCNQKDTHLKIVINPPYKDRRPTANQSGEAIKIITQTCTAEKNSRSKNI